MGGVQLYVPVLYWPGLLATRLKPRTLKGVLSSVAGLMPVEDVILTG